MLPFQHEVISTILEDDGLVVLGRGLGMRTVLAGALAPFCDSRGLVFILNCISEAAAVTDALRSVGVRAKDLPRVLTNEVTSAVREEMYIDGGCFFVTSRILVVDLLNRRLEPKLINGFFVHHAHRVTESSTEAFIIRISRQRNPSVSVKAFTE